MLQRWYLPVGPVFANFVFMAVPPVPPFGTTKSLQDWLQYHWYPRSHPVSRLSCMQKRVPEILELRRRLVED